MNRVHLQHPPYLGDSEVWPLPPEPELISAWESENITLPKDYKTFILKYNGGAVYPLEFNNNIDLDVADENDIETLVSVDVLFDWNEFQQKNSSNIGDWSRKMVAIGYDVTSSLIGISIEPDTNGSIVYWWRNSEGWDEEDDGPLPFGIIANNFREFIFEKLFISEGGGHPRWQLPKDLETARVVEF